MIHSMDLLQEKGSTFDDCNYKINPLMEDGNKPLTGWHPISFNRF